MKFIMIFDIIRFGEYTKSTNIINFVGKLRNNSISFKINVIYLNAVLIKSFNFHEYVEIIQRYFFIWSEIMQRIFDIL